MKTNGDKISLAVILTIIFSFFVLCSCSKNTEPSQVKTDTGLPMPELKKGEIFYRGSALLPKTKGVEVVFTLSADKSQITGLAVKAANISGSVQKGGVLHNYLDVTVTNFFPSPIEINSSGAEFSWGNGNSLAIEGLGTAELTGTLHYVYADTSNPADPVLLDFGSAPITMKAEGGTEHAEDKEEPL
jgi:hypothetical protein